MLSKSELEKLNISNIHRALLDKEFSCVELTSSYLEQISKDETNSFISVNDQAIEQAKEIDKSFTSESGNWLKGVPLAVKDIILVKDLPATAASKILEDYLASYTATAVKRLTDQGMVVLGKTNCDEFAMGSSNENSYFGPVLNPRDKTRVPGGSSGGSAAAVAGNLAPTSLGTDTGGSIRQPAAFCGIVGVKPSYGRVSRYGSIAMASSLDQIGPFAKTVSDAALLLQTMAGYDPADATSSRSAVPSYLDILEKSDPKKLSLGVPKEFFNDRIDKEVKNCLEAQIKKLADDGFVIKEVSLAYSDYALAAYYLLMPAEVSSNLARFDGLLYGWRPQKDLTLDEWYKQVRGEGFSAESKRRIMLGTYILSAGYYDAYYKQAQKVRTLVRRDFSRVFKEVDVLLSPATPTTAFKLGEKISDPLQMYLSDIFTVSANLGGVCGLVQPIGQDSNNLPIGLQLLADSFQEEKLFIMGNYIEKNGNTR